MSLTQHTESGTIEDTEAAKDFLPLKRIDHLEFYVGNAKQSSFFYQ